jgi:hypothetical protein
MPGVPKELIEHRIDINEGSKPVKQRLWHFSPDKKATIKKEITKLMVVGFIRKILHPDWLANLVLVQKNTAEWRMCVDYMDLNRHCPKDLFGLPRIDQIVDSIAESALLSILDEKNTKTRLPSSQRSTPTTTKPRRLGLRTMCYLSESHPNVPRRADWWEYRSIRWWCGGENKGSTDADWRLKANFQELKKVEMEAQSKQICFRHTI